MSARRTNTLRYVLTGLGVVFFLVAICTGGFNEFRYPPYAMYFVAAGLLSVAALYLSLFGRDQRPSPRPGFSMLLSALVPSTNAVVSIGSSLPLGIYTIYALSQASPMVLAVAVPGAVCFLMPIAYPAVAWCTVRRRRLQVRDSSVSNLIDGASK